MVGRNGSFYTSKDKGLTWLRPQNLPSELLNRNWQSIAFDKSQRGIAVGDNGAIAFTDDAGASWVKIEAGISERLATVRINGDEVIVFSSQKIYGVYF